MVFKTIEKCTPLPGYITSGDADFAAPTSSTATAAS